MNKEDAVMFGLIGTMIAFVCALFGAWGTHIIVCLQTQKYLLLIVGALAFPVGIVHGIGIWFGVDW